MLLHNVLHQVTAGLLSSCRWMDTMQFLPATTLLHAVQHDSAATAQHCAPPPLLPTHLHDGHVGQPHLGHLLGLTQEVEADQGDALGVRERARVRVTMRQP
jgi:hypothetical protein